MRDILFRGKRIDNGEWVEGYFGKKINVHTGNDDYYIITSVYNPNTNASYFQDIQVIPETVGQFTGLIDKKGKKIFEGDKLRLKTGVEFNGYFEFDEIVIVEFKYSKFVATIDGNKYYDFDIMLNTDIEVIGNIHDSDNNNPELSEKK